MGEGEWPDETIGGDSDWLNGRVRMTVWWMMLTSPLLPYDFFVYPVLRGTGLISV